ncbi:MAG: hypothetical protein QM751_09605 [Paludibacteraceae bacterium]
METYTEEQIKLLKSKEASQLDISNILLTIKRLQHEFASNLQLLLDEINKSNEQDENFRISITEQVDNDLRNINKISTEISNFQDKIQLVLNKIEDNKNLIDDIVKSQIQNEKNITIISSGVSENQKNIKTLHDKQISYNNEYNEFIQVTNINFNETKNKIERLSADANEKINSCDSRIKMVVSHLDILKDENTKFHLTITKKVENNRKHIKYIYWTYLPITAIIIYLLITQ